MPGKLHMEKKRPGFCKELLYSCTEQGMILTCTLYFLMYNTVLMCYEAQLFLALLDQKKGVEFPYLLCNILNAGKQQMLRVLLPQVLGILM
jgi:hypothetical protein